MTDDWFIDETEDPSTSSEGEKPKRRRRAWWEYNPIVLFLLLFPMVYVRHLFNVHSGIIAFLVTLVFSSWVAIGAIGRMRNDQENRTRSESSTPPARSPSTFLFKPFLGAIVLTLVLVFLQFSSARRMVLFQILTPEQFPVFISALVGFFAVYWRRELSMQVRRYAMIGFACLTISPLLRLIQYPIYLSATAGVWPSITVAFFQVAAALLPALFQIAGLMFVLSSIVSRSLTPSDE